MKILHEDADIPCTKTTTFTVPLARKERRVLDVLKAQGIQKGNWVAQAIREKMERDGLLNS